MVLAQPVPETDGAPAGLAVVPVDGGQVLPAAGHRAALLAMHTVVVRGVTVAPRARVAVPGNVGVLAMRQPDGPGWRGPVVLPITRGRLRTADGTYLAQSGQTMTSVSRFWALGQSWVR